MTANILPCDNRLVHQAKFEGWNFVAPCELPHAERAVKSRSSASAEAQNPNRFGYKIAPATAPATKTPNRSPQSYKQRAFSRYAKSPHKRVYTYEQNIF